MSDVPRRNIDELLARYELEPSLKDIYVEGLFDKEILLNCLKESKEQDFSVYEIDTVNIPQEIISKYALTSGNKQRVIALAKELALIEEDASYRCIADRDLDHWISDLEAVPRLTWTEHTSIELYFFTPEILNEILIVSARAKINDMALYTTSLIDTLKALYSLRLADKNLNLNLEWVDINKSLSIMEGKITFDEQGYIRRLLSKNSMMANYELFTTEASEWKEKLTGDPRGYIRGHDLTDTLAWSIEKFKGIKDLATRTVVERQILLLAAKIKEILNLIR